MEVLMSYKLTIVEKPAYLHAIVTGLNNKENVKRYLTDILRESKNRGCRQVLIEERLEGPRFRTINVFQTASEGSSRAHGHFKAIAYVDVNAENDLMKFAETVAVNRGLPVRVFPSVAEAEKWLIEENHAATDPYRPEDDDTPGR
jgi:hypothetical protein